SSERTGVRSGPGDMVAQQRVEDSQQLVHTGGEGDLLGFAACSQPLVAYTQQGILAYAHQRGHLESSTDLLPATPAGTTPAPHPPAAPTPAPPPAVALGGTTPPQRRSLLPRSGAQPRQRRQQAG